MVAIFAYLPRATLLVIRRTMLHRETERNALIAYGSETGNARDYAEELGRLVERIYFATFVTKLDEVDIVIFLSSIHFFEH